MCDTCLGHWRTDYFCDAKTYAKSLNDRTYLTAED